MAYEYVKRMYGVNPVPGEAVYHTVTKLYGIVKRESKSQAHYVMCRFDGNASTVPCHPTELQYLDQEAA